MSAVDSQLTQPAENNQSEILRNDPYCQDYGMRYS